MITNEKVAIKFKNVSKSFGEHQILHDLNIEIPQGKITTILGFSGAGKSTFMKHILGLLLPTDGEITVMGKNVPELGRMELRDFRKNFGMLFQYAALFDSLTAQENVEFPLKEFTKLSKKEREDKAQKLLLSVNISEQAFHRLPSELSGGMRKRVGLARALALSPQIMLYDEPTTGLDPITTKKVNKLILETNNKYKSSGMTTIIISHDIKATLEISDFIAFLDHGKIIEYLPTQEFRNSTNPLVKEFINL